MTSTKRFVGVGIPIALICLSFFVCTAQPARADTVILSVSGSPANNPPGIFPTQAIAVSFTVGQSYSNVMISADLIGNFTGTAYLMNQIGPGTTAAANQIASAPYTSASTPFGTLQPVMTGITLAPGTYYLVLATTNSTLPQGIQNTDSPAVTADTGASQDGFIYFDDAPSGYVPANFFFKGGPGSGVLEYTVSSVTAVASGCAAPTLAGSTTDFTDRAAFAAATSNLSKIGFAGILPPGEQFGGYGQLDVPGATFSTPMSGTFVNITTAGYYSPNVYPADFIVDSLNQLTGQPNLNNTICAALTQPTFALGLDVGGLGFSGAGSAQITLSNGHTFRLSSLPTVGNTTFVGFIATVPITSFAVDTTNDSWVVEDVLSATPIVNNCTLSLIPGAESFPSQESTGSFQVNTGPNCTWMPMLNDSWVKTPIGSAIIVVGGPRPGLGPGQVNFWVTANQGSPRSGTISVGDQTFQINQAGVSCTASLNPGATIVDASGGDIRVVVTEGAGCAWNATSNASWLTITSSATGSGTASLYIHASANSGASRTGTVTIAGQTLTVQQSAPSQNACGALDVTSMVATGEGQRIWNPPFPGDYTQTITIRNTSSSVLQPPLWLVLVGVPNHRPSPSDVGFIHPADAQTSCFDPNGSGMFLFNQSLAPSQVLTITPEFFIDTGASLVYTPKLISGQPSK